MGRGFVKVAAVLAAGVLFSAIILPIIMAIKLNSWWLMLDALAIPSVSLILADMKSKQ